MLNYQYANFLCLLFLSFFLDPRLKSLGSLVAVTLPKSSVLYTRRGSVIAVNTDITENTNSNYSNQSNTQSKSSKASEELIKNNNNIGLPPSSCLSSSLNLSLISKVFPFVSTKIVSSQATTLLLTSNSTPTFSTTASSSSSSSGLNTGSGAHITIISPTSEQDWVIPDRNNIVAWTGQPASSSSSSDNTQNPFFSSTKYSSVRVHGFAKDPLSYLNPQIAISPQPSSTQSGGGLAVEGTVGEVLEIKLLEDESVFVHPTALLAYSIPKGQQDVLEDVKVEHKILSTTVTSSASVEPEVATQTKESDKSEALAETTEGNSEGSKEVSEKQEKNGLSKYIVDPLFTTLPKFIDTQSTTIRSIVNRFLFRQGSGTNGEDGHQLIKISGPKTVLIAAKCSSSSIEGNGLPSVATREGLEKLVK